jgi:hypothetical protein
VSKPERRAQRQKTRVVTGNGNGRVQHVQDLRRSNAAGIHGVGKPRKRLSVRDLTDMDEALDW